MKTHYNRDRQDREPEVIDFLRRYENGQRNFKGIDLSGGKNLKYLDLENIDFEGANLNSAAFNGSRLTNVSFKDANLDYASFRGCKIKAWFKGSTRKEIDYENADVFLLDE